MGGVRGDFAGLAKLVNGLQRLSVVGGEVAKAAAADISAAAVSTFDSGSDPFGVGWPATKTQGARRLNDSGALRAGATTITVSGSGLVVKMPYYAQYQRPALFWPSAELPPAWAKAFEKHTPVVVRRIIEVG